MTWKRSCEPEFHHNLVYRLTFIHHGCGDQSKLEEAGKVLTSDDQNIFELICSDEEDNWTQTLSHMASCLSVEPSGGSHPAEMFSVT